MYLQNNLYLLLLIFSHDLTNTRKQVVIKKQSNKLWLKQNNNKIQSTKLLVDKCKFIVYFLVSYQM